VALQRKSGEGWWPPTLGSGQMESTEDEEGAGMLLEQRSESRAKRGERGSISILRRWAGEWRNVHGGFAPAERRGGPTRCQAVHAHVRSGGLTATRARQRRAATCCRRHRAEERGH
jgi:hypothetical protein